MGRVIAENIIADEGLPSKLTFEVFGVSKKGQKTEISQPLLPTLDWQSLKPDTADSVCIVDHVAGRVKYRNKLICKVLFGAALVTAAIYGLVYYL